MRSLSIKAVSLVILIFVCVGSAAIALKLFDLTISLSTDQLPGHDLDQQERTARTLELFPFEGWHMQANTRTGDFRLGTMGFAVDFNLLAPPEKKPNEFRIILIGGSGAQGWGATSTEKTMASVLERTLNARADGTTYRVINMAMGSSMTYQNFISLNRWAHNLAPDLILSYSGVNDYTVPLYHEGMTDAHYQFVRLSGLAMAARGSEFPPQLVWLRNFLPNLMTKTTIGYAIKYGLYPAYFEQRAHDSYAKSRELTEENPNVFLKQTITPLYIHAMKSIRRDFDQVPLMIIWQALHQSEYDLHIKTMPGLLPDFYRDMYAKVTAELSGDYVYFANFHEFNLQNPHPGIGVHPNDEGQKILADFIYKNLESTLPQLQDRQKALPR